MPPCCKARYFLCRGQLLVCHGFTRGSEIMVYPLSVFSYSLLFHTSFHSSSVYCASSNQTVHGMYVYICVCAGDLILEDCSNQGASSLLVAFFPPPLLVITCIIATVTTIASGLLEDK